MPKAKFEGIYRSIKQKIEAQDYPYQSLLPAESELIQEYGCARNTLRRALADLTAAGYLQPIQGKGVRVICATTCTPSPKWCGLNRWRPTSVWPPRAASWWANRCGPSSGCATSRARR